jgi:hypothetical protein
METVMKTFELQNGSRHQTVAEFRARTTADATKQAQEWCRERSLNPKNFWLTLKEVEAA